MAEAPDHITCREVVELVTDYLEGALASEEVELFEQHLNFCDGCDAYVDQMRTTVAAAGQIREQDLPTDIRDRLLAAFRDWKRQ
jgi:predicted anti-sigma-YlaC factor YlaD